MIGVASVITTAAIGRGAQAQIDEQLEALGANYLAVMPGSHTAGGVRLGSGTRLSLTDDDASAIRREVPLVEAVSPSLWAGGQVVFGGNNWRTGYRGVTPEYLDVRGWTIASGRAFDAADVANVAKVVVLGHTVATHLFGENDPIGQVIRVTRAPLVVIGVLAPKGQTPDGRDQDDIILMPITTLRYRIYGGIWAQLRLINAIKIKVREHVAIADAQAEIRMLLRQRHRLQPGQADDFTVHNASEVASKRQESTRTMAALLAAVGAVSLLVGGAGIMNMMLASVTERTREIGLRMAVGARRRDILHQFLIEAVVIALVGGACGIMLGIGVSLALADIAGWRMGIDASLIGWAIGFAAAVGVLFGFYPARKASRLPPVVALRAE